MNSLQTIYSSDVLKIPSSATIFEATKLMAEKKVGAALITEDNKVCGLFSERDNMIRIVAQGKDPLRTKVAQAMTEKVLTISIDAKPTVAMEAMFKKNIRHLPVVNSDQKIVGMVSLRTVLSFIVKSLAEINRNMQEELDQLRFLNL